MARKTGVRSFSVVEKRQRRFSRGSVRVCAGHRRLSLVVNIETTTGTK